MVCRDVFIQQPPWKPSTELKIVERMKARPALPAGGSQSSGRGRHHDRMAGESLTAVLGKDASGRRAPGSDPEG